MAESRLDLDRLGQAVAAAQDAMLQHSSVLTDARARVLAHRQPAPRWRRRCLALAAAAGLLAVVFVGSRWWPRSSGLTFVADDRPGCVGRWLPAGSRPLEVRFSDGSQVRLAPRSGGRVHAVHDHGAHILLEHGSAEVTVVPDPRSRWKVEAGPFVVRVLGTQFHVHWDPREERFLLRLERGHVKLNGPVVGTRVIRTSESIIVDVARKRLQLFQGKVPAEGTNPAGQQGTDPAEQQGTVPAGKAPPPATDPETSRRPKPSPLRKHVRSENARVTDLVRRGRYRQALEAARREGWTALLRRAPAATLLALADASRLDGNHERASTIYIALRTRFPGTDAATTAAFFLGREAFDRKRAYAAAARWFAVYLHERPEGPLARESLGRLLEAQLLRGDRPQAQRRARQYLARYPRGPHAKLARSLVREHP